jgi:hypothetical protein
VVATEGDDGQDDQAQQASYNANNDLRIHQYLLGSFNSLLSVMLRGNDNDREMRSNEVTGETSACFIGKSGPDLSRLDY